MEASRMLGIVLMALGMIIFAFGLNSAQTVPEQVLETVKGRFSENTMLYIIGGIALFLSGGFLTFFGKRSA